MQTFSKSADAWIRVVLTLAAALLFLGPAFLLWWVRTPYVTGQFSQISQPIPFDHRHHVVDDGIDCLYCHEDAERSPHAGVPATELCLNCHSQIWNNSPALELVWRSWQEGQPISWRRVNFLPDFVFFDHSIHVRKGVGCETCHGRVDDMPRVYQAAPLTMGWCLDCHRHPEAYLRPTETVTAMGYRPRQRQADLGRELVDRYHVRSITNCTGCHR